MLLVGGLKHPRSYTQFSAQTADVLGYRTSCAHGSLEFVNERSRIIGPGVSRVFMDPKKSSWKTCLRRILSPAPESSSCQLLHTSPLGVIRELHYHGLVKRVKRWHCANLLLVFAQGQSGRQ